MVRATVTPETATRTLKNLTWTSIGADGIQVKNTSDLVLIARSTDVATQDITIQTNQTLDGIALGDKTLTIPIGSVTTQYLPLGSFKASTYNQTDEDLWIDAAVAAKIDVAAFKPSELD